jgi:prolyl-tRNA editing enzyme YbaK/EbsC (Cys-tRNA(Pro) deacylase)
MLIDGALSAFVEIWAAAGTPNAVFKLTFDDLVALTGGRVAAVSRAAG